MSPLPESTEVLVVGGGPAGFSLAGELKRLGVSALIIDQQLMHPGTGRSLRNAALAADQSNIDPTTSESRPQITRRN